MKVRKEEFMNKQSQEEPPRIKMRIYDFDKENNTCTIETSNTDGTEFRYTNVSVKQWPLSMEFEINDYPELISEKFFNK